MLTHDAVLVEFCEVALEVVSQCETSLASFLATSVGLFTRVASEVTREVIFAFICLPTSIANEVTLSMNADRVSL